MKFLSIIGIIFFLSCSIGTTTTQRDDSLIKDDLINLPLYIPAIEAGISVANEVEIDNVQRALDPTQVTVDDSSIMVDYFGTNWQTTPRTPDEVFQAKGTSGQTLRIPESGLIKGLYGKVNNDFYLTMENIGTSKYILTLFIYPRDIFNIKYQEIEYVLDETNSGAAWAWDWFNIRGKNRLYTSEITYFRDGSYSERSSDPESGSVLYTDVKSKAPELDNSASITGVLGSIDNYTIPKKIPRFTTESGQFSSYTKSIIRGGSDIFLADEYYSEDSRYSYSVIYLEAQKQKNIEENVTRYIEDRENNSVKILSLNTNGDYYTEINGIFKTTDSFQSENHVWYTSPVSTLNTSTSNSIYNNLSKATDYETTHLYNGVMKQYWGNNGVEYSYSVNTYTGDIVMQFSSNLNRSIDPVFNLKDISSITIGSESLPWSFSGKYELGSLKGIYKYENYSADVIIYLNGIEINGKKYNW